MTTEKSRFKLVLYTFVNTLLLFGLVRIVSGAKGLFFKLELAGLLLVSLLSFAGLVCYAKPHGERKLFFVSLMHLSNLVLIWYFFDKLLLVFMLLALFLFLLSIPKRCSSCCQEPELEPVPVVAEAPKVKEEPVQEKPKAKHSPGKYVASKRSNIYHEPKCEWAKKINKNGRLWFEGKEAAYEKGYKAHSCVQ
ncbi:MAG: hypothetical protein KKA62_04490 [Nanoarchaeota archaeon]|nr:hypothetical protein [Nanoarchaeota archaeon]MBU1643583.1 hypothetical protein [Nanoarchaeota archaeon]MBU1977179.1 hypothetical protein [Nanoarchaeota archaeon]